MEWVETTARSVEEAKDLLLDQLGVDDAEAEFEVLEEPRPGLFGRTRGQARVRARVMPKAPRAKDDRKRRARSGRQEAAGGSRPKSERATPSRTPAPEAPATAPRRREEHAPRPDVDVDAYRGELLAFVETLLESMGAEATVASAVEDGDLIVRIDGSGLGRLIGPSGAVVDALQELVRTYGQKVAQGAQTPKVRVDVAGYRADRRSALEAFVRELAERVAASGEACVLDPMGSVDRKVVHDVVSSFEGLATRSEGDDPRRRVVIERA